MCVCMCVCAHTQCMTKRGRSGREINRYSMSGSIRNKKLEGIIMLFCGNIIGQHMIYYAGFTNSAWLLPCYIFHDPAS